MIEIQLQVYLIAGIGGGLIALLLLSNILLIYYLTKLYDKVSNHGRRHNQEPPQIQAFYTNTGFSSSVMDLDNELNRRYRAFTPENTINRADHKKSNKETKTTKSQSNGVGGGGQSISKNSVITASEEFQWDKSSKF